MGIAVTSGVLSTVAELQAALNGANSSTNGNGIHPPTSVAAASSAAQSAEVEPSPSSSQMFDGDLETLPNAYIATVHREESARRLSKTFKAIPGGASVKVQAGGNVKAVNDADVVLLW